MTTTEHPYYCYMWFPSTATYATATYKLKMKAFEHGNTVLKSRNQTIARTRAGLAIVHDRGQNFNDVHSWQFSQIPDDERSSLITFLTAIQWAANKIKVKDYKDDEYIVRVNKPEITSSDTGYSRYDEEGEILWDFSFEVLDLTDHEDQTGATAPVSSALFMHLSDYNDPHNPMVTLPLLDIADGIVVVDSIFTQTHKAVTWLVIAEKDDARLYSLVSVTHDGYSAIDATAITTPVISVHGDTGGVAAIITLDCSLTGTGATQKVNLTAETTVDGYTIKCRKLKV
jgi:hypothetical protein